MEEVEDDHIEEHISLILELEEVEDQVENEEVEAMGHRVNKPIIPE